MGKLKVTVTGTPTKKPKVNENGTVDLIIKAEMSTGVPKGLKSLGATLCLVHVAKKTWKKVADKITDDSFLIIQGEAKSRVNNKQVPFLEVITFDISLKEPKEAKKEQSKADEAKDEKPPEPEKENVDVKKEPPKKNEKKLPSAQKESRPAFNKWYEESDIKYVSYEDLILTEDVHLKAKTININNIFHIVNKSKSIKVPIAVKKVDDKYSLIMGIKHFVVAKVLQIDKVPVVEKDMTHDEFIATYKNVN